jgi:hypothetical protein
MEVWVVDRSAHLGEIWLAKMTKAGESMLQELSRSLIFTGNQPSGPGQLPMAGQ